MYATIGKSSAPLKALHRWVNATNPLASNTNLNAIISRRFVAYEGKEVTDADLVKKSDDWVIEETNFCLGRIANIRYKETDDLAHRVLHLMDSQLSKMHTRLRDGTCIPYTSFYLSDVLDAPTPLHIFQEAPLVKWTWDEIYDEAFDNPLLKNLSK